MISASDFYTFYQLEECPRRLWLDANRPDLKAPPSEFDQMLFRKGQEHERAHLATFVEYARPTYPPGDLAAGAVATAKLLREQRPVIYQGVLVSPDRGLAGIPDFLIREGDTYLVREAKLALNLDRHPEIPARIGLYSQLLEGAMDLRPARAEVLMGDGTLTPVEIARVDDLAGRLATIMSATSEPDEAVGWSKCNTCGYTATDLFGHRIRGRRVQGGRDGRDERADEEPEALERREEGWGGVRLRRTAERGPGDGEPGASGGGA